MVLRLSLEVHCELKANCRAVRAASVAYPRRQSLAPLHVRQLPTARYPRLPGRMGHPEGVEEPSHARMVARAPPRRGNPGGSLHWLDAARVRKFENSVSCVIVLSNLQLDSVV